MSNLDQVILGFNHMFLYPESMVDGNVHTESLKQMLENPLVNAIDCWAWPTHAKEELAMLRNWGKHINYNIGDRPGDAPIFPATADAKERAYALDILRRETEFAVESGAKKIVFGSGRDVPDDRSEAQKRFVEFVLDWSQFIPKDIWLTLEPTDRDVDKHFLYGDMMETVECVRAIRQGGMEKMGILLDMSHVPIMHETLESAVKKAGSYIEHIHLGNAVMKNLSSPFYGDKHPCWGEVDGEYDEKDGARFLQLLKNAGYLSRGYGQTISFEMRTLTGRNVDETISYLKRWFDSTYQEIVRGEGIRYESGK